MKIFFRIFLLIFCIAGISFFFFNKNETPPQQQSNSLPMGIGTPDNPNARQQYQFERLKNPTTGKIPNGIRKNELDFTKNLNQNRSKTTASENWITRGPKNVGGRTRTFDFDKMNPNIIISGGVTGGIWKTVDGGQDFYKVTTPDQIHSVTSIAQDKRDGKTNTWYCGTGEYYGVISAASFSNQTSGNGIFKSNDNGETWSLLESTISDTPEDRLDGVFDIVWKVLVDDKSPFAQFEDRVYAAVYNGIMLSYDGGETWQPVLGFSETGGASDYTDIIQTPNGTLYAVLSSGNQFSGFHRSIDGVNWVEITPNDLPNNYRRTVLTHNPCDENEVYFLTNINTNGGHFFGKFTNESGGGAWENLTENLPEGSCTGFYTFEFESYNSQSSYDMCLVIHPTNCDIMFLGGTNVYRSFNRFSTPDFNWIGGYFCDEATPSNYIYPNHHPDIHQLTFHPENPNLLYSSSDGGLHFTDDILNVQVDWTSLNNNYFTTQFYTVAIEPGATESETVVGGMQDNGTFLTTSEDKSEDWNHVFYGDGAYCAIDEGAENYYLSWQTAKIFKFEIDENGNEVGKVRIDPDFDGLFIHPFILDPSDNNKMWTFSTERIFVQNDLSAIPVTGEEYEPYTQGWSGIPISYVNSLTSGYITSIAKSSANSDVMYYGTSTSQFYKIEGIDSGEYTRTNVRGSNFPSGAYMSCVALNDKNVEEVLVTFSNYGVQSIFRSVDGGENYENISGNLEENEDGSGSGPSILWLNVHHQDNEALYYVATSVGLYSTTQIDGNNTIWEQEGAESIGNVVVNMVTSREFDDKVVVATHGNGVYSNGIPDAVGIENLGKKVNFNVKNPFPNPFSTETTLPFSINHPQNLKISLFDINGRLISVLKNDFYEKGDHQISINVQSLNLSSGQYFVRVVGENGGSVVKEVVVQ